MVVAGVQLLDPEDNLRGLRMVLASDHTKAAGRENLCQLPGQPEAPWGIRSAYAQECFQGWTAAGMAQPKHETQHSGLDVEPQMKPICQQPRILCPRIQ